jgi:zinc protease
MSELFDLKYKKFKLDNGLDVTLFQDKTLPIVTVNLWYKVGSAFESKGKTGLTHLFEHMMFQGSQNVPKEKHFKYIQEAGGTLNASTSFDRTNYFETVPSNYLEMVLWLESDRMGYFLPALTQEKLDNQREVVMNERRQRYENQPYGQAIEKLFSSLYGETHPYHAPTIGWMEDIKNFTLDDVKEFFKTFYSPNNASLVIGGDFEYENTKNLVEKYFGELQAKDNKPIGKNTVETLDDVKKISYEDNVQLPRIYLAWHSDKLYGEDDSKLDVLSDILSGSKNSRLYKSLVFEKQIAQEIFGFQFSANYHGPFLIVATARPNIKLETLRHEIFNEIEKLLEDGIQDEEMERAKNSIKSSFIYSLQNLNRMADQINNYNCNLGEPNSFNFDISRYDEVTRDDIPKVVDKYLNKPFVELQVLPKTNGSNNES